MFKYLKSLRADGLKNVLSGYNTARSRSAGVRVADRVRFSLGELDALQQSTLLNAACSELVHDSVTSVTLTGFDDPQQVIAQLDALNVMSKLKRACTLARLYGGAAIWLVCEGGGDDLAEPLDYATLQRVVRLQVIDRWDLVSYVGSGQWLDTDPRSEGYLLPERYLYTPRQITLAAQPVIHASRLIRLYGDPVPDRLVASYDYWGAPIVEGLWEAYQQEAMAALGGSEALYEIGGKKILLPNLDELLTSPEGEAQLLAYMSVQQSAFSTLRSWLVGAGQDVEPITMNLTGWTDVYDRLAQRLAAYARTPINKLYGQAPGGLSTDDEAGKRNWSARVRDYQDEVLRPAINQLLTAILRSQRGPTRGQEPDRWMVEWAPYDVPSDKEESEGDNLKLDAIVKAVQIAAISPDEARTLLRELGWDLDDTDATETPESGVMDQLRAALRGDAQSYTPPKAVQANARRALEVRQGKPPSQRGMTPTGLARARDLANGRAVSMETIRRMASYFERHEVDKRGETWDEQGPGWQAWQGWGGDEGWTWARSIVEREEDA